MLVITIPAGEAYNYETDELISTKETTLHLEHSLISLSKWESKWHKPFLTNKVKTQEESIDYIRCMTLDSNVNPTSYLFLTPENVKAVNDYIENPMTATTFRDEDNKAGREIVTAEIIYYWMVALQIPFECEKWHLNRLLTLVKVCNIKNTPKKKMKKGDMMRQNASLNAARRAAAHSHG